MRVTWKHVREEKFPALLRMARQAGVDPAGWELTWEDTPLLVVTGGATYCQWSTARECAEYLQAWIDALSVVARTVGKADVIPDPEEG